MCAAWFSSADGRAPVLALNACRPILAPLVQAMRSSTCSAVRRPGHRSHVLTLARIAEYSGPVGPAIENPCLCRPGWKMDYKGRIDRLRETMDRANCSLCVLAPGAMLKYFTGFTDDPLERLLLCLLTPDQDPVFVAPKLFVSQIRTESPFGDVRSWIDTDGPLAVLSATVRDAAAKTPRILVDDGMQLSSFFVLQAALPRSEMVRGGELMGEFRTRKDPEEVALMKRAARIADAALEAVLARGIGGRTELEVALALKSEMVIQGADSSSFEPIIGSGPNGAVGHHRPGQRRIGRGDAVIMDFGCRVDGYCSDVTRTVFCSSPSKEAAQVYEAVRTAQETAVKAVQAGMEAQDVDRVANETVLASGMGDWHRTGHGIGLEVHEPPYIVKGNRQRLDGGMTFSVEPGIYLSGRFGVRVEDVVLVTTAGQETMSEFTRSLVVVE
jgi:Xaa-Pro aminopeptidase